MANYTSQYTGAQIDQAIGRALPGGAIDEAVSNKAGRYTGMLNTPATIADIVALGAGTYGWVQTARQSWQPEDVENSTIRCNLFIQRNETASQWVCHLNLIDGYTNRTEYIGELPPGAENIRWSGKLATTTPPTEYDLPLADGFIADGVNSYFKTQDNIVTVMVGAKGVTPTGLATIATLPVGFRPSAVFRGIFTSSTNDTARVLVMLSGEIKCQFSASVDTFFGGGFSFLAGG